MSADVGLSLLILEGERNPAALKAKTEHRVVKLVKPALVVLLFMNEVLK